MRRLDEMTWPEVEALALDKNTLVILPVGATEQHGERMPLGTDFYFASYWAERVAKAITRTLLMPTLNYGMSWHHTSFAGTISIEQGVYILLIRNIIESIVRSGFRRILIVNGHMGNDEWINNATKIVMANSDYSDLKITNPVSKLVNEPGGKDFEDQFEENFVHGGAMEASLLGGIKKEYLRNSSVVTSAPENAILGQGTDSPLRWKELFPRGGKGDQRKTDFTKGKEMNEFVISRLVEIAQTL